jgi:Pentapeptide repeats (8 copies)
VRNPACRSAVIACALIAAAVTLIAGCGGGSGDDGTRRAGDPGSKSLAALPALRDLLIVVHGPATVSGTRLTVDSDTVEWFTDRPKRRAGVAAVSSLAKKWDSFGFADDPPNASIAGGNLETVVELQSPELTDDGISFGFKPLRGELAPADVEGPEDLSVVIDDVSQTVNGCEIQPYTSCPGANLYGAELPKADLEGADLQGAELGEAELGDADLSGANLSDADLSGADLSGANLTHANLADANFTDAYLFGANLAGADIAGANLSGAGFCGTVMPDGSETNSTPDAYGAYNTC